MDNGHTTEKPSKIKLLVVAHYMIVPPVSGGAMRMINPLIELGKSGEYEVTLFYRCYDYGHVLRVENFFKPYSWMKRVIGVRETNHSLRYGGYPRDLPVPDEVFEVMNADMRDQFVELLKKESFDIIQLEHSHMAWLAPYARKHNRDAALVLDVHNMEHLIFKRRVENGDESNEEKEIQLKEWLRMETWERTVLPWFDGCLTVSPIESDMCKDFAPKSFVEEVPTGGGMDLERFPWKETFAGKKKYDLLYVGTMNWYPNAHGLRWFIDKVFPLVSQVRPEASFHILGFERPYEALLQAIKNTPNVHFHGEQVDELKFMYNCAAFIVPLWIAAGARVKIVTAWAAGAPVAATTIGAEGLACEHGKDIMIGDTPVEFAKNVLCLLDDVDYATDLRRNARHLVEERYSLTVAAGKIDKAYKAILERPRRGGNGAAQKNKASQPVPSERS